MKLLLQTWMRGCDWRSRSSALRQTDEYDSGLHDSECPLASRLHAFATTFMNNAG